MKICAIICEFNPFHNGHQYLLSEAKKRTNADALLCIMSGNFVQRGEIAILDKYTRAKHAVECGADIVIELPTVFATSNAEIFASGAISILSKIPSVTHLAFGAEYADKTAFLETAKGLINEPPIVAKTVKALMDTGVGYAQAIATARAQVGDKRLFESPNNILGIEYTKAILAQNAKIEIVPIQRLGSGYNNLVLEGTFASASAIRKAYFGNEPANIEMFLPSSVHNDLTMAQEISLDTHEKLAILQTEPQVLATTLDCSEGLENAFLKACMSPDLLEKSLSSPRYTAARIRRIALQNLLGIREPFIRACLSVPLYLQPLAYRKARPDLLSELSKASIPFLSSGKTKAQLIGVAKDCYEKDDYANNIYAIVHGNTPSEDTVIL